MSAPGTGVAVGAGDAVGLDAGVVGAALVGAIVGATATGDKDGGLGAAGTGIAVGETGGLAPGEEPPPEQPASPMRARVAVRVRVENIRASVSKRDRRIRWNCEIRSNTYFGEGTEYGHRSIESNTVFANLLRPCVLALTPHVVTRSIVFVGTHGLRANRTSTIWTCGVRRVHRFGSAKEKTPCQGTFCVLISTASGPWWYGRASLPS